MEKRKRRLATADKLNPAAQLPPAAAPSIAAVISIDQFVCRLLFLCPSIFLYIHMGRDSTACGVGIVLPNVFVSNMYRKPAGCKEKTVVFSRCQIQTQHTIQVREQLVVAVGLDG
jgi:hypothetical protein